MGTDNAYFFFFVGATFCIETTRAVSCLNRKVLVEDHTSRVDLGPAVPVGLWAMIRIR